MSDLAQRLRLNATIPLVMEAADRIEALEAALREQGKCPDCGQSLPLRYPCQQQGCQEQDK